MSSSAYVDGEPPLSDRHVRAGKRWQSKLLGVCGTLNSTAQAVPQTKGYFRRVRESNVLASAHARGVRCFQDVEIWESYHDLWK